MADEENPFGGGPFGVGPFGPLVAAAAAAAATFSMVVVTTSVPVPRTLFYQANIKPPVIPAPAAAEAATFSVTTGGASSKSLFYQSNIKPPLRAAEVVVDVTPAQWLVPLSRAVPRSPVKVTLTTPFVPQLAPAVTADAWLQPFKRQVAGLSAPSGGSPFVPKEAVLENTQTPDKWLPRWQGPPSYHPAPQGGSPFIPREAVRDNTVTPDAWMLRWQKAVPPPRLNLSDVTYTQPPTAVSNLTTTLEWMPAWSGTKRPLLSLAGGVVNVPIPSNLTTTLEWQIAWRGPPRSTPAPQGGQPFVPKEAVLENTVTPDKWLFRWHAAVPVPPVHHTQPVLGYPYEAASNLTTTLEWMQRWQGPPRYWPIKVQALPFVPKADVVDQVTPDKWLIRWQGPPRYMLPLPSGSPFVAKEAVLENTQTPDKWLVRFAKAVPVPKPVPTQPEYRYPYETQAIVVPYEQWWHQPLSRAAALTKRPVHNRQFQPFVPREPVLENTQTPDKWHRDLSRAAARPQARPTQPTFVYSPPAVVTLTTTLEWQPPLSRAVAVPKARPTQPVYAPIEPPTPVVAEEFVTASVAGSGMRRKTLHYQSKVFPPYPYEAAPPPAAAPLGTIASITTGRVVRRSLFYQSFVEPYYPYEAAPPDAIPGGPADEPERVVCVLPHSRVATVPESLRMATVLVDLRVATVPEESRTVEVLLSDRDEESNQFTTLPCAGPIVMPVPEGENAFQDVAADQDAVFQDDAFQDDAFQDVAAVAGAAFQDDGFQ